MENAVKRGRPRKADIVRGNSVQEGLTADYTRATFIVKCENLEKLKKYAVKERLSMKDAVNGILENALEEPKKEKGVTSCTLALRLCDICKRAENAEDAILSIAYECERILKKPLGQYFKRLWYRDNG